MYSVVMNYLDDLNRPGSFQGVCYSNLAGTPTTVGEYGSIEYLGQPSNQTPKYNALVAFPNSPKLAITGLGTTGNAAMPPQLLPSQFTILTAMASTQVMSVLSSSPAPIPRRCCRRSAFTAADGGIHTFTETLKTSGLQDACGHRFDHGRRWSSRSRGQPRGGPDAGICYPEQC